MLVEGTMKAAPMVVRQVVSYDATKVAFIPDDQMVWLARALDARLRSRARDGLSGRQRWKRQRLGKPWLVNTFRG